MTTEPFELLGQSIRPIRLLHGKLPILGLPHQRRGLLHRRDAIPDESWSLLEGLDTLVIDALRDQPHPTHFSVAQRSKPSSGSSLAGPISPTSPIRWNTKRPTHGFQKTSSSPSTVNGSRSDYNPEGRGCASRSLSFESAVRQGYFWGRMRAFRDENAVSRAISPRAGAGPLDFSAAAAIFLFFLRRKKGGRHHRKIIPAEFVQIDLRESTPAR